MVDHSSASQHQKQKGPQPRYGLIKMRVDTQHVIRGEAGRKHAIVVRSRERYPAATISVRCLFCRGEWPSTEEMVRAHADHRVMVQQEEAHVWGFYSEDPLERGVKLTEIPKDAKAEEKKRIEETNRSIPRIGFLSDEEL